MKLGPVEESGKALSGLCAEMGTEVLCAGRFPLSMGRALS
jgi:hypothetical protein